MTGRRHRNAARIEIGQGGADAARARDHAGDAEADVVGALVADHLQRQPRVGRALDGGSAIGVHEVAREGGEESGRRRAEADAGDIHSMTAIDDRTSRLIRG